MTCGRDKSASGVFLPRSRRKPSGQPSTSWLRSSRMSRPGMNGSYAGNPKRKLQHAIALIECVLSHKTANRIPGIEIARKAAIPILKQNQPAAGENPWRNELIIKASDAVCSRHDLKPTRNPGSRDKEHDPSGCSVVAELFRLLGIKLGEKRITDEIWLKRTPP